MIKRTCNEYGVGLPVTDKLRAKFKSKLWRMGQRLSKAGSTKRQSILQSWEAGEEATWEIQVDAIEANKQLVTLKRKSDTQLTSEKTKRLRLQNQVQKSSETLTKEMAKRQELQNELTATKGRLNQVLKENQQLTRANKRLSSTIVSQNQPPRRKRSDITALSRQQQWSRKKQLHTDINQALLFLEDEGVQASSVSLLHTETHQSEVLDLEHGTYSKPEKESRDTQSLELVLFVKERFGLSDSAYHELSMVCQSLPRSWKLKHLAKELNSKWVIMPCPGGDGVQQSLQERLTKRVKHLLQEQKVNNGDKLQVKLCGDGTKVCRKLNLINFAFTLLNEGAIAKSPRGNHTVAIVNGTEDYGRLKISLSDVVSEVERLATVAVNDKTFPVEYFLCSDLKFLAIICGIGSASSTYACVWCICPSSERHDMTKEWSATDPAKGACTIADIVSRSVKHKHQQLGCARAPLFHSIPLDHVIPDVLHLFLRVTDILFNLLILDIRRQDGIEQRVRPDSVNSSSLSKLQSFLNDTCHIPCSFFICKESKKLKWRDFMGPGKLTLFKRVDLPAIFSTIAKCKRNAKPMGLIHGFA